MAQKVSGLKIDTRVLDRMVAEARPKASKIINTFGLKIASDWAANVPVDTGAFRSSILSESQMAGEMTFIAQDGVEYGVFVELGTSRMAARPSLVPAIENNRQAFFNAFKELFE